MIVGCRAVACVRIFVPFATGEVVCQREKIQMIVTFFTGLGAGRTFMAGAGFLMMSVSLDLGMAAC